VVTTHHFKLSTFGPKYYIGVRSSDPVTKSQGLTNSTGAVVSWVELDPWGGETGRSSNPQLQPHRYTSYERDSNGGDEAMFRRYESKWQRFAQPDPYDGSYDPSNPQSLNRYAYVQNDPVNLVDPSGLLPCYDAWCGSSGGSGWGGGYSGGNGWGSDLRPGRGAIGSRDSERTVAVAVTRFVLYLPEQARYIGGLSWGYWGQDAEDGTMYHHTYTFSLQRLGGLTFWGDEFAFGSQGVFRNV
jgi:RHS repeat-associated protein